MSEFTTVIRNQLASELKRGSSKDKDFTLYHSLEMEQMLLPETAHFLATKTYFKMLGLPLHCEARANAEFMSPGGAKTKLPILRCGSDLVAEFQPLVDFMEAEGHSTWPETYDDARKKNYRAALLDMDAVFTNAELFLCWMEPKVRAEITYPRYGCPYEWPLSSIQCWRKFYEVKKGLDVEEWDDYTVKDAADEVKLKCSELSEKLQDKPYFNGDFPTDFDALIFGHLYAILTTDLNNTVLAEEINKKQNLVRFCQNIDEKFFSRAPSR